MGAEDASLRESAPPVVYVLPAFPALRNTFVVREMDGLDSRGVSIGVVGLLRPEEGIQHPRAQRWLAHVAPRPTAGRCLGDLGWWLLRRPVRLISVASSLLRSNVLRLHRPRAGAAALLLGAAHARRLREQPQMHLHAHFEIPSDTAWVMHRLAGFPFSFTMHTDEGIRLPGLVRDARAARFVATPSRYTQALLQEHVGPCVEVAIVRAAVPVGEYAFRARSIPTSGPVRAVTVAGLEEYKGHSVLLHALADEPGLARITLDIVGDGPLRPKLEALTRSLALEERVTFRGALTEDGVRIALDEADLFVLPSTLDQNDRADNIPVALMEAMSSGVPVVASRLAGIPELVVDGSTGYLAEPGNTGDLARVLGRILEDPAVLTVTEHARRMVEDEFDIELNAARLVALIRNGRGTVR